MSGSRPSRPGSHRFRSQAKARGQAKAIKQHRRVPLLEPLEHRLMLTLSAIVSGNSVILGGDTGDSLYLKSIDGLLAASTDGTNYTTNIDGYDVTITPSTSITSDVEGNTYLGDFSVAPGTITAFGTLEVQQNAVISTRDIAAYADPTSANSLGNSNNLTLVAPQINVDNGAEILAQANEGFAAGNITFTSDATLQLSWSIIVPDWTNDIASGGINIGAATIKGATVSMSTAAGTTKTLDVTSDLALDTSTVLLGKLLSNSNNLDLIEADQDNGGGGGLTRVFMNNGTTTPYNGVTPSVVGNGYDTTSATLADLNNDGLPDLVLANNAQADLIYLNTGNASNPFNAAPISFGNSATDPTSVSVADLGNGLPDIIIGNSDRTVSVFMNTGNASAPAFGTNPSFTLGTSGATATTSIAVGNVTNHGNGLNDLVVAVSGVAVDLYVNNGNSSTPFSAAPIQISTDDPVTALALGNVANHSNSNELDLVVANTGTTTTPVPSRLYVNSGATGGSNPYTSNPDSIDDGSEATTSVALGDVLGNGELDVALGNNNETNEVYANNGSTSGDPLSTTALDVASDQATTTSIAIGDVTGDGNADIVIGTNAELTQVYASDGSQNPFANSVAQTVVPETQLAQQVSDSTIFPFNVEAAAIITKAASNFNINGATISATGNVDLTATADTQLTSTTIGLYLGATYADSEATANIVIGSGSTLTSGGTFTMDSEINNELSVSTYVAAFTPGPALTISYAKFASNSSAIIDSGASVTAASATVESNNTNSFNNAVTAIVAQSTGVGAGAGVAISDVESNSQATVSGSLLSTTGDITIQGTSNNTGDQTNASASAQDQLSNTPVVGKGFAKIAKLLQGISLIEDLGPSSLQPGEEAKPSGAIGAGAAIVLDSNTTQAYIGTGGSVESAGNLTITATATDNVQSTAAGTASNAGKFNVGGAFSYARYTNEADAYIGAGANADAVLELHVVSDALYPNPFQIDFGTNTPFNPPNASTTADSNSTDRVSNGYNEGNDATSSVSNFLSNLSDWIGLVLGSPTSIATTFTQSGGALGSGGSGIGIAGGVNIVSFGNTSNAYIGAGATVNQDLGALTSSQTVWVESDTTIETINVSSQFDTLAILDQFLHGSGSVGAGGSLALVFDTNTDQSYIGTGAKVTAGGELQVTTNTYNYDLSIAEAGSAGSSLGVDGAFTYFSLNNSTLSDIAAGAIIDANAGIQVLAIDNFFDANAAGGVASGATAVGLGGAYNNVSDTAEAYIGSPTSNNGTPGSITTLGPITVQATSNQEFVTVGISASFSPGISIPAADPANDVSTSGVAQAVASKSFGIGISGDVSVNYLSNNIEAFIANAGTVTAGGLTTVNAANDSLVIIAAGSVGYSGHTGVGGAANINNLNKTTKAYIAGTTVSTGSLSVTDESTINLYSVAADGTVSSQDPSVAGSVNLDYLSNDVEADLGSGAIVTTTTGAALIQANSTINTITVSGLVSLALGGTAVGAALDLGIYNDTVLAYISNSATLEAAGNISLFASASETFRSVGASLAAGTGTGVGASGSGAAIELTPDVEAYIGASATVSTPDNLYVNAYDNDDLLIIAGGVGGGASTGVGLGVAVDVLNRTVKAYIDDDATVSALGNGTAIANPQSSSIGGVGITIDATTHEEILIIAASGGVGVSSTGVAASLVVDNVTSTTDATINSGATINSSNATAAANQSVWLNADNSSNIISIAGTFAGGSSAGIGAAVDDEDINRTVQASIGASATVNAADNVIVSAESPLTIDSVSGAAAGSGTLSIAGSVSVLTLDTTTEAYIDQNATVLAAGNVSISADHDASVTDVAGQAGFGGSSGIGASTATVLKTDTTEAYIGEDASVSAAGNESAINVLTGALDNSGNELTKQWNGLSITATLHNTLLPIAAGADGGGNLGIAGSATVDILNQTTLAYIGQTAQINPSNGGAGSSQGVNILADDALSQTSIAGALTGGGSVGIGAGADGSSATTETEAFIAASAIVYAVGTILVQAVNSDKILSIAASASLGGTVAMAGAASVYILSPTTIASIGAGATVNTNGNVQVAANDSDQFGAIAGNLSGSGTVSVGASAAVLVLNKTTSAYIDQNATVNALGNGSSMTVDNGQFSSTYTPSSTDNGVPLPSVNNSSANDSGLTSQYDATPATTSMNGVAVTAVSQNGLISGAISGGAAGLVAVQVVGDVEVPTITTSAYIGSDANINTTNTNAASDQGVWVAAGMDMYRLGIAGAASASGVAAVDPGADIFPATLTTTATIGSGAQVEARGDVGVVAFANEHIISIAAGFAASGDTSVAGTVSVLILHDTTTASIGSNALVDAGGNVVVAAHDGTTTLVISGSVAIGFATGGIGAAVSLTLINKDTEATIGAGATVNALANSNDTLSVPNGSDNSGNFGTSSIHGVAVVASSFEHSMAVAAAGAGGLIGGLAGAVSVEIDDSQTHAAIGSGAAINSTNTGASNSQTVVVAATNDAQFTVGTGAAAGGLTAGLAGGVDVADVQNSTTAAIGSNANVNANGDVDINALSYKYFSALVISAAAGSVGVAGAVDVFSLGAVLDANAKSSLTSNDGSNTTTGGYVDTQANPSAILGVLGNYNGDGSTSSQNLASTVSSASSSTSSSTSSNTVSSSLNSNSAPAQGTASAIIGSNTTITAGGSINLNGLEQLSYSATTGAGSVGLASVGGSVTIADIQSSTGATVGSGTTLTAGSSGSINLNAALTQDNLTADAYGGSAGGLVGLGAQVAIVTDTSTQTASLGNGDSITRAGTVGVQAQANRSINVNVISGVIGGGVAAGAAIGEATAGGSTSAQVGNSVDIGQVANQYVSGLSVSASDTTTANVQGHAVAAAILGGGAGDSSTATINPSVSAGVGSSSDIAVTGNIDVSTSANETATSNSFAVAAGGGVAIAVAPANSTLSPSLSTSIGSNTTLSAGNSVTLFAGFNVDGSGNPIDQGATSQATGASGALLGSGNGLVSNATVSPSVEINGGSGMTFDATSGNFVAQALSGNYANATLSGTGGGLVSVGAYSTSASVSDTTEANVGGATINTNNVTILATSTDDAYSSNPTGGVGAATVNVNSANSSVTPTVAASLGDGADVTTSGNVTILATTIAGAHAETDGFNLGGLDFSASQATSTDSPTISAGVGENSSINANGIVNIELAEDYAGGNDVSTVTSTSDATGANVDSYSGGGGLIGLSGSSATTNTNPTANLSIGNNTAITSSGDLTIAAQTYNPSSSSDSGYVYGFAAVGSATTSANDTTNVTTTIGSSSTLTSSNDITVGATSYDNSSGAATAGQGGIFADGSGPGSNAGITNNTNLSLGSNTNVNATGNVSITTSANPTASTNVSSSSAGLAANADGQAQSSVTTNTALTVGSSDSISGNNVTVTATIPKDEGDASASFTASGLAGFATATGNVYLTPTAILNINQNATIAAEKTLTTDALEISNTVNNYSNATINGGGGTATANGNVHVTDGTYAIVAPGAIISGQDLDLSANSTNNISNSVHAYAHTLEQALASIFTFGTVKTYHTHTNTDTTDSSAVLLNGEALINGHSFYNLTVNPNDSYTVSSDFPNPIPQPTISNGQVVLPDLVNTQTGSMNISASDDSGNGTINGTGSIHLAQTISVDVVNNTNDDLVVNQINSGEDMGAPPISYNANYGNNASIFFPTVHDRTTGFEVELQNNGSGSVYLEDNIYTPTETVNVATTGGSVYQTSGYMIFGTIIDVTGSGGTVGTQDDPIFEQVAGGGSISGSSLGNMYLTVSRQEETAIVSAGNGRYDYTANASVLDIDAGGTLTLLLEGGLGDVLGSTSLTVAFPDQSTDTFTIPTVSAVSAYASYDIDSITTGSGASIDNTSAGAILDGLGTGAANVSGPSALITTGTAIGTSSDPLYTALGQLEATANSGGIWLTNTGTLTIGGLSSNFDGLSATGPIVLTNLLDPLTLLEDVKTNTGNITIRQPRSNSTGQNLTIDGTSTVQTTGSGGTITIESGDNITIDPLAVVEAPVSVTINAEYIPSGPDPDAGVGSTIYISGLIEAPTETINGGHEGNNDIISLTNVVSTTTAAVDTYTGFNTINVGSLNPFEDGVVDPVQGPLTVNGDGNDTMNVDDQGSVVDKSGLLTETTLTGLMMGSQGITYYGLIGLHIVLGTGNNDLQVTIDANTELPITTTILGGSPTGSNTIVTHYKGDFTGVDNVTSFQTQSFYIDGTFNGIMNDPGPINILQVGNSVTPTSIINAASITTMTIGSSTGAPTGLVVGANLAGTLNVTGDLHTLIIGGGTPGTITAGSIGNIETYGGFGQVVAQINEGGVQRNINNAAPGTPYPLPNADATVTGPYINFQYMYQGSAASASPSVRRVNHATPTPTPTVPQVAVLIDNGVANSTDQFDFSLVSDSATAKFDLAYLSSVNGQGDLAASGIRNITVEGDLLTTMTAADAAFLGLQSIAGGIRLTRDHLASVGIRDFAPQGGILAATIEAVSFGEYSPSPGLVRPSNLASAQNALALLAPGTKLAQADDTFRVAVSSIYPVALFLYTNPKLTVFNPLPVLFSDHVANDPLASDQRHAVIALVSAAPANASSPYITMYTSNIDSIAMNGDGGSFQTYLPVLDAITSTGAVGDISLLSPQGLTASLVAPRIFGSINAPNGSITGTIQTTGLQTDPITNVVSTVPSTIGRAYVVTTTTGQTATATTISAGSGPISGTIFTPGDLISQVVASGGISGLVFAGGDIGATENYNKTTIANGVSTTQTLTALVGGVQSNGTVTGEVEALGDLVGNFTATGGLWGSGRLIIGGSIIGNVKILDRFGVSSAVIAGGSIGSSTYATKLTLPAGSNQGTVAAVGAITFASGTNTRSNAIFQNLPNVAASALAIDTLFTQLATDEAVVTSGALLNTTALDALASDVARLRVVNGALEFE